MTPLLPEDIEILRSVENMVLVAFPEALFVSAGMSKKDKFLRLTVGIAPTKLQGARIRIRTYVSARVPYQTEVEFLLGSARPERDNEGSQQAQVS